MIDIYAGERRRDRKQRLCGISKNAPNSLGIDPEEEDEDGRAEENGEAQEGQVEVLEIMHRIIPQLENCNLIR